MSACPTKLKIPRYIEEIAEGMPPAALATIREDTCMAGTLGRVCVRPCESNCRRANMDEPISIKYLKRFAADYGLDKRERDGRSLKGAVGSKKSPSWARVPQGSRWPTTLAGWATASRYSSGCPSRAAWRPWASPTTVFPGPYSAERPISWLIWASRSTTTPWSAKI